jgi:hypothetical protein
MKAARIRLIVAALLLAGWLGFLGYLALGHAKAVVVSRSQLLVASHIVKAEVDPHSKEPRDVKVLESFGNQHLPAGPIVVENIGEARLPGGKEPAGAGVFLLLLERTALHQFRVVGAAGSSVAEPSRLFLIYPWSDEVERQVREQLSKRE